MYADTPKIKCPICGQEYMPSEIYIPKDFFGNQDEIFRDASGSIEFFTGSDMELNEEYVCDNCGASLKIKASLSFEVEANESESDEYVSTFEKPKKIKLEEVNLFDNNTSAE